MSQVERRQKTSVRFEFDRSLKLESQGPKTIFDGRLLANILGCGRNRFDRRQHLPAIASLLKVL